MQPATATQLILTTRGARVESREQASLELSAEFLQHYQVGEMLGCGAMGMVCRGVQLSLQRPVAIKFLKKASEELLARFLREGRVLARISHPAVTRVFDSGEMGGHPYLVTELLEGGTLTRKLSAGPLPWEMAVAFAVPLVDGLAACYAASIVHRDLKPDNILFGADRRPRIADLGVARDEGEAHALTKTGALIGTPLYMAPEQLADGRTGTASDIWSIAAVIYQMIAGQPPYTAKNLNAPPGTGNRKDPPLTTCHSTSCRHQRQLRSVVRWRESCSIMLDRRPLQFPCSWRVVEKPAGPDGGAPQARAQPGRRRPRHATRSVRRSRARAFASRVRAPRLGCRARG